MCVVVLLLLVVVVCVWGVGLNLLRPHLRQSTKDPRLQCVSCVCARVCECMCASCVCARVRAFVWVCA